MCSSVPLAVDAILMDTVDYGCSSREKTCASSKSESLTTFVSGTYSRKVFIGGLPPDLDAGMLHVRVSACVCGWGWGGRGGVVHVYKCIGCMQLCQVYACLGCFTSVDQCLLPACMHTDDIQRHFAWCGALQVDWPYRTKSRALFPPKGN